MCVEMEHISMVINEYFASALTRWIRELKGVSEEKCEVLDEINLPREELML